jgi:hypothetical protein
MYSNEPLIPESSPLEAAIAIANLERYTWTSSDQTAAELIQAEGETLVVRSINTLHFIWKKEELPEQWNESIIAPFYKKGDKTD